MMLRRARIVDGGERRRALTVQGPPTGRGRVEALVGSIRIHFNAHVHQVGRIPMGVRGPVWGRTGWENGGRHSNWTPEEEVKTRRGREMEREDASQRLEDEN